ncbi:TPA: phosphoethanolamine transferase [Neisseria subflava]
MKVFFQKYSLPLSIIVFSLVSNFGLGYLVSVYTLAMFFFWYGLFLFNKKIFSILFLINLIVCVLFAPIAYLYGRINIGLIASLFETNLHESTEFINLITWQAWATGLLVLISGFGVIYIGRYTNKNYSLQRHKYIVIVFFSIFLLFSLHKPTTNTLKRHQPFNLVNTEVGNINFYFRIFQAVEQYYDERIQSEQILSNKPVWEIIGSHPKYKNYVLVIGESMRADYMSLYGFPIDTTPYLRRSNGLVIDEFIAPAPNTQTSLTRMLHLTQGNIISYPNNLISLAKAAGFKTYWLSTQPTSDDADTAAARVGIQADYSHFYDPNSSRDGKNSISDFILLEGVAEQLKQMKNAHNSLFVLHINGSHPDFCKRLIQPVSERFKSEKMSCYLETLKQTDQLLQRLEVEMKSYGSYSIMYLSDHGLAHIDKNTDHVSLLNSTKDKQAYHVPFIKISSDDTKQVHLKVRRSGFDFIYAFSEWLGIDEKKLKLPYRFFSEDKVDSVKIFNWEGVVPYETLHDDPALQP